MDEIFFYKRANFTSDLNNLRKFYKTVVVGFFKKFILNKVKYRIK